MGKGNGPDTSNILKKEKRQKEEEGTEGYRSHAEDGWNEYTYTSQDNYPNRRMHLDAGFLEERDRKAC